MAIAHPSDGVTAEIAQVPLSELTERTSVTTVDVGPVDEGDGTPGEVEENVGVQPSARLTGLVEESFHVLMLGESHARCSTVLGRERRL